MYSELTVTGGAALLEGLLTHLACAGEVALVVEGGPYPVSTDKIIDALNRHGVKATFLIDAKSVESITRRIQNNGHKVTEAERVLDKKPFYLTVTAGSGAPQKTHRFACELPGLVLSMDGGRRGVPTPLWLGLCVLSKVVPGSTITVCDGTWWRGACTAMVLDAVIPALRTQGYSFRIPT